MLYVRVTILMTLFGTPSVTAMDYMWSMRRMWSLME